MSPVSSVSPGSSGADVTGTQAQRRAATPARVVVAAAQGVDIDELLEACRVIASSHGGRALEFVAFEPGRVLVGAHAAVLVIDPACAVVDDDELTALRELTGAVDHVGIVCGRIESFWDWPRIVRGYRSELDPGERLPVFAVSAATALAGAVDDSGVVDLLDWCASPSEPSELSGPHEGLRQACAEVGRTTIQGTGASTDAQADALVSRRTRLLAVRDRGRSDRLASLRAGIAHVRAQSSADIATRVRVLATLSDQRGTAMTRTDVEAHAAWLDREIGGLVADLDAVTRERLDAVASSTLVGLDADDPPAHRDDEPILARRELPSGRRAGEDAMVLLLGASTGIGIGRLLVAPLSSVQTLQWIAMPAALLIGVAVAIWVIRMRRGATLRTQLRTWVNDVLADVRARTERRVAMQLTEAESRIGGQVMRAYDRQTRRIAYEVADIDQRRRDLYRAGREVSGQ